MDECLQTAAGSLEGVITCSVPPPPPGSEIGTRFTPLNIAWLVTVALWIYSHGCTHFTSCNNTRKGKYKISAWKSLAPIYFLVIFIQHCYTQYVALEGQCRPMSQELSADLWDKAPKPFIVYNLKFRESMLYVNPEFCVLSCILVLYKQDLHFCMCTTRIMHI